MALGSFAKVYLDAIRNRTDLVALVAKEVQLRQVGQDYVGRCPFHNDSTPSFRVNQRRYICFGCGEKGSCFNWVMKTRGVDFPTAVRSLRGGIQERRVSAPRPPVQETSSPYDAAAVERIIRTNDLAWGYFQENAPRVVEECAAARGLTRTEYGYSPLDFRHLQALLMRATPEELIEAGIAARSVNDFLYIRLRGRLILPLRSPTGHILGFTGRAIPGLTSPGAPKYLDPPRTAAFSKPRYLYNYNRGAEIALVVEGPLDALAFERMGRTAFATMGTELSAAQVRMLEYTTCVLCYDSDMPGIEAMFKHAPKLSNVIAVLPEGKDPADLSQYEELAVFSLSTPQLMSSIMKREWDMTLLHNLSHDYVLANIREGFPHYNILEYVMQARPEHAAEIRDGLAAIKANAVKEGDAWKPMEADVKQVLRGWFKACRDLRKEHGEVK